MKTEAAIIKYKGCLIYNYNGVKVFGKTVASIEEAMRVIDAAFIHLKSSIK